jgi:hypothetical protein
MFGWKQKPPDCPACPPPAAKEREWMVWMHDDSGRDQVGRTVNIDGRTGKVVDGTISKILVEWD